MNNRIKDLRTINKLTQQELAEKAKIGYRTISDYERGISTPDADSLRKLALVFNVTTDYLLGITNNPNSVKINVADADGTTMQLEYELLNKISGLTVTDLQKISEYVDFIKMQKGIKKNEK